MSNDYVCTISLPLYRIYLPATFVQDAHESNPDLGPLWERIEAYPMSRRGGGTGYWVDLTWDEAQVIHKEAVYRAEYWLTDAYGVEDRTPSERTAGKAAARVRDALMAVL